MIQIYIYIDLKIHCLRYLNAQRGATAVEYGLIAAGISVLILGAVFAFGEEMQGLFERISDMIDGE